MNSLSTRIRLIDVDDADAIAAHVDRDAKALLKWEPARAGEYYTTVGQCSRIERLLAKHDKGELWPAVILASDTVIGQVTVQNIIHGPLRKAFLGYWVASTYQGQGHATRAVGLAIQLMHTELELHRAEAFTQLDNSPSQSVLRNNGFTTFGIAHSHIFIDGAWRDEIMWELLLEDGSARL